MKIYEIIAGMIFALSTIMKLGCIFILCHSPIHLDEVPHEYVDIKAKKQQSSHHVVR